MHGRVSRGTVRNLLGLSQVTILLAVSAYFSNTRIGGTAGVTAFSLMSLANLLQALVST